jgi:hypothetical protein
MVYKKCNYIVLHKNTRTRIETCGCQIGRSNAIILIYLGSYPYLILYIMHILCTLCRMFMFFYCQIIKTQTQLQPLQKAWSGAAQIIVTMWHVVHVRVQSMYMCSACGCDCKKSMCNMCQNNLCHDIYFVNC